MTNLTNFQPGQTYADLLTLGNDNSPGEGLLPEGTLKNVQDGNGINSPMQIATDAVNFNRTGGNEFQLDGVALTAGAVELNLFSQNAVPLFLLIGDNPTFQGTGSIRIPTGTTAQRPNTPPFPFIGAIRYNTTRSQFETYAGNDEWWDIISMSNDLTIRLFSLISNDPSFYYSNSALTLPAGITSQRPDPAHIGDIRFNVLTAKFEGYDGTSWKEFTVT